MIASKTHFRIVRFKLRRDERVVEVIQRSRRLLLLLRVNDLNRVLIHRWRRLSVKLVQVKRKRCIIAKERPEAIQAGIVEIDVAGKVEIVVRFWGRCVDVGGRNRTR